MSELPPRPPSVASRLLDAVLTGIAGLVAVMTLAVMLVLPLVGVLLVPIGDYANVAWLLVPLLGIAGGLLTAYGQWCRDIESLRRKAGQCPQCGYDLRATPGRCPECGRRGY